MPCRFERNRLGGRVIIYIRENIASKQVIELKLSEDVVCKFIKGTLRKTRLLIFGTYRPPCQSVKQSSSM